jgi:hypothetical protein
MIVYYFDQCCIVSGPLECQAKLVVDPNAVIGGQVAFEPFEPITGRYLEVPEFMGGIEHIEVSTSDRPGGLGNSPSCSGIFAVEDIFRGLVAEVEDHCRIY